jgi:hypothetical protein
VTFLREAQSKTLAATKISGATGKVCGFGVHKNPGSNSELWIYYVETAGAEKLNTDCSDASVSKKYPGDSYKLETFIFRNGVAIGAFNDLFFLSPHGEVYTNGSDNSANFPVKINLSKDSTTLADIVQIDESGRIH